jgi:Homeodomain-like domain
MLKPERDPIELARDGSVEHRLGRRANALLLLNNGMSCAAVAKVLFIDDDTVRTWHRLYEEDANCAAPSDRKPSPVAQRFPLAAYLPAPAIRVLTASRSNAPQPDLRRSRTCPAIAQAALRERISI